jgi:hypothetical protein
MKSQLCLYVVVLMAGCRTTSMRSASAPASDSRATSAQLPATARVVPTTEAREDPAVVRRELLARLDRRIDEMAARARLEARLAIDEVMPVPYLGVDSDLVEGGLKLTAVYADTGAERAGLQKGDLLRTFDGVKLDSKAALARAVRSHRVGDTLEIAFASNGNPRTTRATLGPRPEEDEDESEQFPDLVGAAKAPPAPLAFDFDDESVGTLPRAFGSFLGGHGREGAWVVAHGAENGLTLRQDDNDTTGIRFPMAIVRDWSASDCVVRVRFRYVGGRVDRAAGIVLRWRDPSNYLVARANAAEGDLRIFRVVNGDRRTLPGAIAKGATDDDRWHTLEFRAHGTELTAILDGDVRATAQDSFFLSGQAGVWTKSDSRTDFDDLKLEASP